jgi:hypothetical protein
MCLVVTDLMIFNLVLSITLNSLRHIFPCMIIAPSRSSDLQVHICMGLLKSGYGRSSSVPMTCLIINHLTIFPKILLSGAIL